MPTTTYTVTELAQRDLTAGNGEPSRAVVVLLVIAANRAGDSQEAWRAAYTAAPATLYYLPKLGVHLVETGGGLWTATVTYGVGSVGYGLGTAPAGITSPGSPPTEPGTAALGPEWSFDTAGQQTHVMNSRKTLEIANSGGTTGGPSDFNGAINVDKDGVHGVDIVGRRLEISLTIKPNYVTLDWIRKAYKLTGTVNHDTFLGFAAGELLFLGCNGQSQAPTDGVSPAWTVSFKWAVSPNRVFSDVDPVTSVSLTGVQGLSPFLQLGGWDYVWVEYAKKTVSGRTADYPIRAYREQVYDNGDFTTLGLFS